MTYLHSTKSILWYQNPHTTWNLTLRDLFTQAKLAVVYCRTNCRVKPLSSFALCRMVLYVFNIYLTTVFPTRHKDWRLALSFTTSNIAWFLANQKLRLKVAVTLPRFEITMKVTNNISTAWYCNHVIHLGFNTAKQWRISDNQSYKQWTSPVRKWRWVF